jgi:signal transduction histidine kinase
MSFQRTVNNINYFEKNISKAISGFLSIAFIIATLLFSIVYYQNMAQENAEKSRIIETALSVFRTNISEKLLIIANSDIFVKFFFSGAVTRKELEPRFLTELLSLNSNAVIGYSLTNTESGDSYQSGRVSSQFVTLKLCYLDNKLDSENGKCFGLLTLFFSEREILKNLFQLNNAIKTCASCEKYSLSINNYLGFFPIQNQEKFEENITVESHHENIFSYYIIIISILFGFALFYKIKLRKIINKAISNPLNALVCSVKKSADVPKNSEALDEINYLSDQIRADREAKIRKINEYEKKAAVGLMAARVAHDIRSPLAAMEANLHILMRSIPKENLQIMNMAIQSVRDISNNLLEKYREKEANPSSIQAVPVKDDENTPRLVLLFSLIDQVISQKRYEWINQSCELIFDFSPESKFLWVHVAPAAVKRMISNLLNNAIEACEKKAARIHLSLSVIDDFIGISITDNGLGFSEDMLASYLNGKSSKHVGEGLGLSTAKKYIESLGGQIEINSTLNIGTTVLLKFKHSKPTWCPDQILLSKGDEVVILDDDVAMQSLWMHRLENYPIKIHVFNNYNDAEKWIVSNLDRHDKLILLVDYELSDESRNGLMLLKQYGLASDSYLITSHAEEFTIQAEVGKVKIKLIPKLLVNDVPIKLL